MAIKKSTRTGVDSPFSHGRVTPFRSGSKLDSETGPKESSKSLLKGPSIADLGSEKGRLDRLFDAYKNTPVENNLNALLAEVERYARRVTVGKGGKLNPWL